MITQLQNNSNNRSDFDEDMVKIHLRYKQGHADGITFI